jgi:hypothetical protein
MISLCIMNISVSYLYRTCIMTSLYDIIMYHEISYPGDFPSNIIDKLDEHALSSNPAVQKQKEGGLEGVPTNRQVRNKAYLLKKHSRTQGEPACK